MIVGKPPAVDSCSECRQFDAADTQDPTGTWKFSLTANNQTREFTLKLKVEGEKLTVDLMSTNSNPIEDGTFKDDKISFVISRERNGQKIRIMYSGKIAGDVLKGTILTERDGKTQSIPWEAKREKGDHRFSTAPHTLVSMFLLSVFLVWKPSAFFFSQLWRVSRPFRGWP